MQNYTRRFFARIKEVCMITYEPFRRMTREREISTYRLINYYKIGRSLLNRLKHDKPITTVTLNDLCCSLGCRVEDILEYRPDEPGKSSSSSGSHSSR
jgi:Predicted transcriptional regulator